MKVKFIIAVTLLLAMVNAGYSVYGSIMLTEAEGFTRTNVEALALDELERNNTETVIRVDLKKMHKIDLHGEYAKRICLLDNGSPALVDEVKKVVCAGGQYVVQCKNKVLLFDAQTGAQKTSFSGQWGPDAQFVGLLDTWVEGDTICMYDMARKQVFRYDFDSKGASVRFVVSTSNISFQYLAKAGEGHYVGKRMYGGGESAELNLYDKNFQFVKEIGDFKIKSGIYICCPFFVYRPDEILYNRYFSNDIYVIDDKQNVSVKYSIDFGEKNMPVNPNWQDEYDCIDFINSSKENYATLVSNIYESDKYFCFRFAFDGEKCLGVYNKSSGEAAAFVFVSSSESPRADVYVFDDKALLVTQDMGKTCLTTISVNDLLKNNR